MLKEQLMRVLMCVYVHTRFTQGETLSITGRKLNDLLHCDGRYYELTAAHPNTFFSACGQELHFVAGLHAGVCPLPCYLHREAKTVSGRDTSGASAVSCPTASIAPLVSPAPQMRSGFVPLFSTGWEASQLSFGHPAPLLNSTDLFKYSVTQV